MVLFLGFIFDVYLTFSNRSSDRSTYYNRLAFVFVFKEEVRCWLGPSDRKPEIRTPFCHHPYCNKYIIHLYPHFQIDLRTTDHIFFMNLYNLIVWCRPHQMCSDNNPCYFCGHTGMWRSPWLSRRGRRNALSKSRRLRHSTGRGSGAQRGTYRGQRWGQRSTVRLREV